MFGIVLAFLVLFQTLQLGGNTQYTAAATVPDDVIKQVLLLQGQSFSQSELLACFDATATDPASPPAAPPVECSSLLVSVKNGSTSPSYSGVLNAAIGAPNYPFTLAYEWKIGDDVAAEGGTYVFDLPPALKLENDESGTLGAAGSFTVDKNTKKVTIQFKDQSATPLLERQTYGGLQVNAWLEETTVIENKEIEIRIPYSATGSVTFDLPVNTGTVTPNIEKRFVGVDRTVNTSRIDWEIDANRAMADIANFIVRDTLPTDVELDATTLTVHPLQINMAGQVTELAALTPGPTTYSVDTSVAGQFSIVFGGPTNAAYRIKFSTNVKSTADITEAAKRQTNNVQLLDGTTVKATSSAYTDIKRGPLLRKSADNYLADQDHTVTWTLNFNFGELTHTNPVLTDILPAGHEFVAGSLTVEKVQVNADGTAGSTIGTALTEGAGADQYSLAPTTYPVPTTGQRDSFKLTLNGTVGNAYKIVYKTKAKITVPVVSDETKSNSFTSSTDPGKSGSDSVNYLQRIIDKTGRVTDYSNKEITWTIVLNKNEYRFEEDGTTKVTLVDTFDSRGLSLQDATLTVTPKGGAALVPGSSTYTLTKRTVDGLEEGFNIVFSDSYLFDKEHTITYKTTFDYDSYPAASGTNPKWSPSNYQFKNTGVFSWGQIVDKATGTTRYLGAGSQTDSATPDLNAYTQHNGYKNGTYDARDKTILWNVMFNYHNETVSGATLTDTLLNGQELVPGTVVIKRQTIGSDGTGTLTDAATLVEPANYTVSYNTSGPNPVVTITFAGSITGPHLVTFKTELNGEIVPKTINNTAEFRSSSNNYRATLNASVSPNFGNDFIVKSFRQPDNTALRLAEWTLWINRSLSKLNEIVVEDTPDQYQTIVPTSFTLHKMVPNISNPTQNSHFTASPSAPLVKGTDYTVEPLDGTSNGFKLTIANPGEAAYRLVYNALLSENVNNSTTNQYKMSGWGSTIESTTSQHTFNVNKSSASGFSFPNNAAYKGSVKLVKQAKDDNDVKLEGAVFKIKPKYGNADIPAATTDKFGVVTFTNLPFDVYEIEEVTAPNGYKLDTTKREIIINSTTEQLVSWENVANSGRIGNYVWLDRNRDGVQNDGPESGINGITVKLYKVGDPTFIRTTTTADSTGLGNPGYYLFDGLEPGDYEVEFEIPDSYKKTRNVAGQPEVDSNLPESDNSTRTGVIKLERDAHNKFEDLTIDLGLVAQGAIGDYVWLDRNRDGVQDSTERGIDGIEVILYDNNGTEVERTTTGPHPTEGTTGYYWFEHLLKGTYVVEFLVPRSYKPTRDDHNNSAADSNNTTEQPALGDGRIPYRTDDIVIGPSPSNWEDPTIDLGLVGRGTIGDYVWFDKDNNGKQGDSGDYGVDNITVTLYTKDSSGDYVYMEETTTSNGGKYLFEHLLENDYYVKFTVPDIFDLTEMEKSGVSPDEDSNRIYTADVAPDLADIGVTVDPIRIGPEPGELWENLTIDLGLTGKGRIGDYVWHDRDWDGTQDEDPEHGINGVKVYLYKDTTSIAPYKETTTANDSHGQPGYYMFTDLPEGTYYVRFEFDETEYSKTRTGQGDSSTDSNFTENDHTTRRIDIGDATTWVNETIDLGLVAQGEIGNYVWFDTNRNGIQDANEQGVDGIRLNLYKNGTTTIYATTDTVTGGPDNKPGYYLFDNLTSGDYYVQIELDSDHEVTIAEEGTGPDAHKLDSNAVNASNRTDKIEIRPINWIDHTIDFGIVRKGAIGNYVWYDTDFNGTQDEEDRYGMNGVTVKLYDSNKTLLATTITADKDSKPGYYLFDHLVAGDYYVQFVTPYYYIPTKQGAPGVSAELDSNPTFDGFTEAIEIGPVGPAVWQDMTIDQGYYYVPPVFPTPTPSPSPSTDPEETEEPGITPTPTPSPGTGTPTPTPTPGTGMPTPTPAPTPTSTTVTEKTPEDTPIDVEVDVPKGGTTATGTPPKNGSVTITPDGKVTYTPNKGYTGKDRFSVIIKDADGNEEEFWFDIDVEEPPRGGLEGTPDVSTLPKTGQDSYLMLYLLGAAFVAIGIYLRFRNNRKTS
ncbi:SdrD B-like domain-containing protein [Paenibacillus agaridevorans]|uniref:SdrD B-like domain-containing protein n=1 Tax=Paenibacillus agaridevorans TaxID=171404 RepID=UPI001BE4C3BC|nr:SdrD B-like domain-containing protein [Paenibacillus agaridevorans]